ncbi:PEP-CTERM sorting domain-containing protein [Microcoleus sp. F4-D5]|uniref:PEP-CTERM sorting domain-containing protein n=1 Tax=Microcoleus sp. F4-D5 TaxID=2818760 RepID=UPI002FD26F0B
MKNLYHTIAFASVCTALGFALGASPEAKAATITLVGNGYSAADYNRDGLGDFSHDSLDNLLEIGEFAEFRALYEFNIANLSLTSNTIITQAVLQVRANPITVRHRYFWAELFGYRGNGEADASDFEAGIYLRKYIPDVTTTNSQSSQSQIFTYYVAPFISELINNKDAFAGFGIRATNSLGKANLTEARLIIETADVAEPVPEPTTIFGSAIALGVAGWLKRKKKIKYDKIVSAQ